MLGVFRPEPKFLAVFPSVGARRFSVWTKVPGDVYEFKSEVSVGQDQKYLAVFSFLNARGSSVRTKIPGVFSQFDCEAFWVSAEIPGSMYHFECEVFVGQKRNSWRFHPV